MALQAVEGRMPLGEARQAVRAFAVKADEIATQRLGKAQKSVDRFQFGILRRRRRDALVEATQTKGTAARFLSGVNEVIRDDLKFDGYPPVMGASHWSERSYRIVGSRDTGSVDAESQAIREPLRYALEVTAMSDGMHGEMPNYRYYGIVGERSLSSTEAETNARRVLPAVKAVHEVWTGESITAPIEVFVRQWRTSDPLHVEAGVLTIERPGFERLPVPSTK